MEIAESARKHGVSDEDILHAMPFGRCLVGTASWSSAPTATDASSKIAVLDPDDDPVVIHADALRQKFYRYL